MIYNLRKRVHTGIKRGFCSTFFFVYALKDFSMYSYSKFIPPTLIYSYLIFRLYIFVVHAYKLIWWIERRCSNMRRAASEESFTGYLCDCGFDMRKRSVCAFYCKITQQNRQIKLINFGIYTRVYVCGRDAAARRSNVDTDSVNNQLDYWFIVL